MKQVVSICRLAICSFLFLTSLFGWEARADWQKEWERTLEAGKREGRLNLYVGRYGQAPLLDEFKKEFPEIKVVTVNGTGNQLATRILAEARAGKVVADLYSGGANSNFTLLYRGKVLDSIKSALILPGVLDESKWYGGGHAYTDPEQKYIFIFIANPGGGAFSYNATLVDPKEFKSYWDLVHPKWKGKIVSQPPTSTGIGANMQFLYYHRELGPEFIKRLYGTMDLTYGDRRVITDWLAVGKFALCIGCRDAERAKRQGLPVDEFDPRVWKEGQDLTTGGGSLSLIEGRPHPNAAKVFINWFLSRKGQLALQMSNDLYGELPPNSRRIDIPKDMLDSKHRLIEGRKYLDVSEPKFADMTPILQLAKEIMKAREQKKE